MKENRLWKIFAGLNDSSSITVCTGGLVYRYNAKLEGVVDKQWQINGDSLGKLPNLFQIFHYFQFMMFVVLYSILHEN